MPRLEVFDFKHPDYVSVYRDRAAALDKIRSTPGALADLKAYYRADRLADFVNDWGVTYDPRNLEVGLPAIVPFVLFDKQREFVDWVIWHWRNRKPGLAEKSREEGMSWLVVSVGCALCIFNDGMRIGYGSRLEDYVDKIDEPKSLFWKARFFMRHLPEEFRAGWREGFDSPYMRMKFPDTGSSMTGEAGDEIGRGDRTGVYFVDEAAHLKRPKRIDAALSQTTNCRLDVSSVNGMNNPFAQKRHGGKIDVFILDWHDDPRKDQAWYEKQKDELDPVVLAQEIDRDYTATMEGLLIPAAWARAAVGAREHLKLGPPTGSRRVGFDVADEGVDKNAIIGVKGYEVQHAEDWSGKGDDIMGSVERVFLFCDEFEADGFSYDADGVGAGVRGDARIINARRKRQGERELQVWAFRASEGVANPEAEDVKGRKNEDFFANRKSQSHWSLRTRFRKTYRWVVDGVECSADEIISISPSCPNLQRLIAEVSQPTFKTNDVGKIVINKKPDDMKSPNMMDALVQTFARSPRRRIVIPDEAIRRAAIPLRRRRFG